MSCKPRFDWSPIIAMFLLIALIIWGMAIFLADGDVILLFQLLLENNWEFGQFVHDSM